MSDQDQNQEYEDDGIFKPWPTEAGLSLHRITFDSDREGRSIFMKRSEFISGILSYFEWLDNNPLKADKVSFYQGDAFHEPEDRCRIATLTSLCLYLGVSYETWLDWKGARKPESARPELVDVIVKAEKMIRDYKLSGAAGGLLNAQIVMRDLGLAERQEVSGPDGKPLEQVVQYQLPSNGRDGGSTE